MQGTQGRLPGTPERDGVGAAATTPFVGRQADLAEIAGLLATSGCRLLTLVGPGGIGKTRLALAAAAQALRGGAFVDGTRFVSLQPVASPDLIVSAMADALRLPHSGARDPQEQLLAFLHGRAVLLVLDNLEHLLEGSGLLAAILAAAPGVKLLVTSREALYLQEEWRYPVQGLPYPERDGAADLEGYAAVQLFAERARRVRRDFSLAAERAAVVRICRLVEGLPLALELAATWTSALPCAEIAIDLALGLEVLSTRLRDVPERHRSMQAVFDQSWARLEEGERVAWARLSVFRGGFQREAAVAVAGASVRTLSALVDKSLVRLAPDGRYHLHELLRQYAEGQLWETPGAAAVAEAAHGAWYIAFLAARLSRLLGAEQRAASAEVRADRYPLQGTADAHTPRAVGGSAARAVLDFRHEDGANQAGGYADTTGYRAVNTPDVVHDPNHWQPLRVPDGQGGSRVEAYITPHWGTVRPFALTSGAQLRPSIGPRLHPCGGYALQATQLLRLSAGLTDRHKAIAEYWADGPATELPPGHWCLLAQQVSRRHGFDLDADVKLFFILTNALLDASIAAWDAKRAYDYVRPITALRHLFRGRRVPAWGGPHQGMRAIDGADWRPYQIATFVTPAFPECVSGHSTFSAAAAEVLKRFTGSDAFGASATVRAGSSRIEPGRTPASDVVLSWATFSAAAEEAGMSRRYGGIHFEDGDVMGRTMGRAVGATAWAKVQAYFRGTA